MFLSMSARSTSVSGSSGRQRRLRRSTGARVPRGMVVRSSACAGPFARAAGDHLRCIGRCGGGGPPLGGGGQVRQPVGSGANQPLSAWVVAEVRYHRGNPGTLGCGATLEDEDRRPACSAAEWSEHAFWQAHDGTTAKVFGASLEYRRSPRCSPSTTGAPHPDDRRAGGVHGPPKTRMSLWTRARPCASW